MLRQWWISSPRSNKEALPRWTPLNERGKIIYYCFFLMVSLCQILTYLCLLEISSALGFHPQGTRRRLSRRLSTVTEFRCTTWNPGAMPPRCLSLEETKPAWSLVMKKTPQPKVKNGTNSRRQLPFSLLPGVTEIRTVKLRLSTDCSGYFKSISSHKKEICSRRLFPLQMTWLCQDNCGIF